MRARRLHVYVADAPLPTAALPLALPTAALPLALAAAALALTLAALDATHLQLRRRLVAWRQHVPWLRRAATSE